ncbi:carbonic anhydrase 7 [Hydra vulgaris]|uniref:carbonic anhydrase 7 n=1 Tax=Hydra vulgaris TaxID=6087 RepID=UPI00019274E7|nr:carbonic anhydrase 7 [Hydra vulgaris]
MKLVMLFTIVCSSLVRGNTISQENSANFDNELNASQEELMNIDSLSNATKRSNGLSYSYNMGTSDVNKNGPNYWRKFNVQCDGNFQSPINIIKNRKSVKGKLRNQATRIKITFPGESSSTLKNNGHTLQLSIGKNKPKLVAFDSSTSKEYNLQQIHFHFGCNLEEERKTGSEHRIDGKAFDLEVHFVFQDNTGVLSVVGVLFNEQIPSNEINNDFESPAYLLLSKKEKFQSSNDILKSLLPEDIYGESGTNNYFSYRGSLTTPPCTEGVHWNVIADPKPVQQDFMNYLRKLQSDTNHEANGLLCDNSRPIQDYQHTVYYKYEK